MSTEDRIQRQDSDNGSSRNSSTRNESQLSMNSQPETHVRLPKPIKAESLEVNVKNLGEITEKTLHAALASKAVCMDSLDKVTRNGGGTALLTFCNPEAAKHAVQCLDGELLPRSKGPVSAEIVLVKFAEAKGKPRDGKSHYPERPVAYRLEYRGIIVKPIGTADMRQRAIEAFTQYAKNGQSIRHSSKVSEPNSFVKIVYVNPSSAKEAVLQGDLRWDVQFAEDEGIVTISEINIGAYKPWLPTGVSVSGPSSLLDRLANDPPSTNPGAQTAKIDSMAAAFRSKLSPPLPEKFCLRLRLEFNWEGKKADAMPDQELHASLAKWKVPVDYIINVSQINRGVVLLFSDPCAAAKAEFCLRGATLRGSSEVVTNMLPPIVPDHKYTPIDGAPGDPLPERPVKHRLEYRWICIEPMSFRDDDYRLEHEFTTLMNRKYEDIVYFGLAYQLKPNQYLVGFRRALSARAALDDLDGAEFRQRKLNVEFYEHRLAYVVPRTYQGGDETPWIPKQQDHEATAEQQNIVIRSHPTDWATRRHEREVEPFNAFVHIGPLREGTSVRDVKNALKKLNAAGVRKDGVRMTEAQRGSIECDTEDNAIVTARAFRASDWLKKQGARVLVSHER